MKRAELKAFLDEKAQRYEQSDFLSADPIQVPHQFSKKEDIEIMAFLTATIAWGNRQSIIKSAHKMGALMDGAPFQFICQHQEEDRNRFQAFVHRTFNGEDVCYFMKALQFIYTQKGGLEALFTPYAQAASLHQAIHDFRTTFFSLPHSKRTEKHVADPLKGSAAKRLNVFLRWMVRSPKQGVDFGLWTQLHPRQLSCPLDVHSGNVARALGILSRKQNDHKAVLLLDDYLRKLDPEDPVKYDFALFGLGVFEQF